MSTSEPLLSVNNLAVSYGTAHGLHQALRGVSFTLQRGTKTALVGESGSGKSTIANAILGLLPRDSAIAGTVHLESKDLMQITSERAWRAIRGGKVALIPQDPLIALDPVQRVGQQVVEAIQLHRPMRAASARTEAVRLLAATGIAGAGAAAGRYPHQLSGGQLQRVLIAIALSGQPSLIVADEPTSGLDVIAQQRVLREIDDLVHQTGAALLLITHDLSVARDHAERVIVLRAGAVLDDRQTADIERSPVDYTRQLFAASAPGGKVQRGRPPDDAQRPLAELRNVSKTYAAHGRSGQAAGIRDVSLRLYNRRTLGLVGESGSGKSTTAKIAAGLLRPDTGAFIWQGGSAAGRGRALPHARDIQFVFQNPYSSLNSKLTVERIIREPLQARGIGRPADWPGRVAQALDAVGLAQALATRRPNELSGGQRQRVAIARAIIARPRLLILDEPVSALDVTVQRQIMQLLENLQTELDLSYLFISHDLTLIRGFCDDVAIMQAGSIVEYGTAREVFTNPVHSYTRSLLGITAHAREPAGEYLPALS